MKPVKIESVSNPRFKEWRRIASGQIRKVGRTLVSGKRQVEEIAAGRNRVVGWLAPEGWRGPMPPALPCFELARALFDELDQFGTGYPLLDVDVVGLVQPLPGTLGDGMYVAIPLQDPANVGAAIRSAAGLSASGAFLLDGCASPFHPKAVRASAAAVFRLPLFDAGSLERLPGLGFCVLALDAGGVDIRGIEFPRKFALVVGQEGPGIAPLEVAGIPLLKVSLPMDRIESYNAGVAAALAMWEFRRRGAR